MKREIHVHLTQDAERSALLREYNQLRSYNNDLRERREKLESKAGRFGAIPLNVQNEMTSLDEEIRRNDKRIWELKRQIYPQDARPDDDFMEKAKGWARDWARMGKTEREFESYLGQSVTGSYREQILEVFRETRRKYRPNDATYTIEQLRDLVKKGEMDISVANRIAEREGLKSHGAPAYLARRSGAAGDVVIITVPTGDATVTTKYKGWTIRHQGGGEFEVIDPKGEVRAIALSLVEAQQKINGYLSQHDDRSWLARMKDRVMAWAGVKDGDREAQQLNILAANTPLKVFAVPAGGYEIRYPDGTEERARTFQQAKSLIESFKAQSHDSGGELFIPGSTVIENASGRKTRIERYRHANGGEYLVDGKWYSVEEFGNSEDKSKKFRRALGARDNTGLMETKDTVSIGKKVSFKIPGPNGPMTRIGFVVAGVRSGELEVKTQQGEYFKLSNIGPYQVLDTAKDAARLIHTETNGNATVKVYWNGDWEEYVARLFVNGVENANASYHTDDKDDAISTAKDMARRASTSDSSRSSMIARKRVRIEELKRHRNDPDVPDHEKRRMEREIEQLAQDIVTLQAEISKGFDSKHWIDNYIGDAPHLSKPGTFKPMEEEEWTAEAKRRGMTTKPSTWGASAYFEGYSAGEYVKRNKVGWLAEAPTTDAKAGKWYVYIPEEGDWELPDVPPPATEFEARKVALEMFRKAFGSGYKALPSGARFWRTNDAYGTFEAKVTHKSGNVETFWVRGSTFEEARAAAHAELMGAIGFKLELRHRESGETKTFHDSIPKWAQNRKPPISEAEFDRLSKEQLRLEQASRQRPLTPKEESRLEELESILRKAIGDSGKFDGGKDSAWFDRMRRAVDRWAGKER